MWRKKFCVCILTSQTHQCTEHNFSLVTLSSSLPPPLSALSLHSPGLPLFPPKNPSILLLTVLKPLFSSICQSNSTIIKSFNVLIDTLWIIAVNFPIIFRIKLLKLVLLLFLR